MGAAAGAGSPRLNFRTLSFRSLSFSATRGRLSVVTVARRLDQILNNKRHTTIDRIERRLYLAQPLICETAHLGHLVGANSAHLHQPSRRIGAIRGQLPIAIAAVGGVRFGIGAAFDRQFVRQLAQLLRKDDQQVVAIGIQFRAADIEERSFRGFEQFDAQAFVGNGHVNVVAQLVEIRNLANRFLQLFLQRCHIIFGQHEIFALAHHVAANFLRSSGGILEISADGVLHLLAAVQQPEPDEQGHHGGDEIRVGHFPRAAMVAAVAALFLDDDDRSLVGHEASIPGVRRHAAAGASLLSLMNFSAF